MAEMGYGIAMLFAFAVVAFLAVVLLVSLLFLRASRRDYLILLATFGLWVVFVAYKLGDEIRAAFIPRGHYYSILYKNESNGDIFVDGVGDLRRSKNSGSRTVHRLPDKIVWWSGSAWRKANKSDMVYIVVPPPNLRFKDSVIFSYQKDATWKIDIEQ